MRSSRVSLTMPRAALEVVAILGRKRTGDVEILVCERSGPTPDRDNEQRGAVRATGAIRRALRDSVCTLRATRPSRTARPSAWSRWIRTTSTSRCPSWRSGSNGRGSGWRLSSTRRYGVSRDHAAGESGTIGCLASLASLSDPLRTRRERLRPIRYKFPRCGKVTLPDSGRYAPPGAQIPARTDPTTRGGAGLQQDLTIRTSKDSVGAQGRRAHACPPLVGREEKTPPDVQEIVDFTTTVRCSASEPALSPEPRARVK